MIEFGKTLRAAREAKGYTSAQLAEITHLAPATIGELENDDFSRIAAPIYGRGFVKLYCAAVGIDPQPMVKAFMDIIEGKGEIVIRERPTAPEPPSAVSATPAAPPIRETQIPAAEPAPAVEPTLHFDAPEPVPPPSPIAATPPPTSESAVPYRPDSEPTLSRYAAPLRQPLPSRFPPNLWRMCILAAAGMALLILIGFGIRALYRATDPRQDQTPLVVADTPAKPATPVKPSAPAKPRTPIEVPPLYVD